MGYDVVADALADGLQPLVDRLRALERRVAETEAKAMRFHGTWSKALDYSRGAAVVHDGSLWVCTRTTTERPGTGDAWQMAIKSGRHG